MFQKISVHLRTLNLVCGKKKLMCCYFIRRADQLIQEDKDDVIPYCIAIGDVKKLVNFFMLRGQLKEALLVAQVQPHNYTGCTRGGRHVRGKFVSVTQSHD